jgi:inorganic pyrophosphatase
MPDLTLLSPYDDDDALRVVVEAPRNSSVKLEYDAKSGVFTVSRSLPVGMAYPFDWGFIPGTIAEDGDPVDALAIHPAATFPGVVLPCRLLGMVEIEQTDPTGKPQINNRVIATPAWHEALKELEEARELPKEVRRQLERFFVSTTAFTGKQIRIKGWASVAKARRFIKSRMT